MQNLWKSTTFALAAMLVGSLVTGVVMSLPHNLQNEAIGQGTVTTPRSAADAGRAVQKQNLTTADNLSSAFRNVAEALKPSVVSISTKQVQMVRTRGGRVPQGVPPGFEELFGGGQPQIQEREASGMGSGVIVRPDGYILTNNHVIEGADELTVEFSDGRIEKGTVVGTDPQTDLAVVKVELVGLRPAIFGSSDEIQVGDWVLAIGSPFGLDQTVTAGIISGKNRVQRIIADGNGFEDFLQTDAAINPGNSGGPLVNLRGELVGINTAILSRSGASAGIGFAIPVSLARPVLEQIVETGQVRRGFLGAAVVDVTPEAVDNYALDVRIGGFIGSVLENQPAAKSGLQPGDVVTKLDGRKCTGGTQLRNYVASRAPGTLVKMEVNRGGKILNLAVTLGERTEETMAMFSGFAERFGADLIPVTPESAQQYGYPGLRSGLIVSSVQDEGIAADADLQVGDVIESASGTQLTSPDQLEKAFGQSQKSGQPLRLIVRRGNQRVMLVLR
ncbi:putative periplasmic serine endoprotease DegP-like precursor [Rubripirellula lacrimiformis]|uniref:Putative periplasmic serine endoprotease DegP-like n=1 Tax=Rubripirellula lacrimiformis TaxID=1930273 RepID=A0A517NFG5_9BACT|nr:Do family serine endopeptidase [Rubripirellula lacrimiformis]QDT05798.1 putative periplasmic serine endoprotease DegP-like precursor [Rubripirellula lacrimiformis]